MDDKEFEELTEEDRELVLSMRELQRSRGWQLLAQEMEEWLKQLRDVYESDSDGSFDRLVGREFIRGQIYMLKSCIALPTEVEENAKFGIQARQSQLEEKGNDGSSYEPSGD